MSFAKDLNRIKKKIHFSSEFTVSTVTSVDFQTHIGIVSTKILSPKPALFSGAKQQKKKEVANIQRIVL